MTPSSKILLKIVLWSGGIAAAIGVIYWILDSVIGLNGMMEDVMGNTAALIGIVAVVTFIFFLISLVVASSRGN